MIDISVVTHALNDWTRTGTKICSQSSLSIQARIAIVLLYIRTYLIARLVEPLTL